MRRTHVLRPIRLTKKAGADAVDPGVQEKSLQGSWCGPVISACKEVNGNVSLRAAKTSCTMPVEHDSMSSTGGVMERLLRDCAEAGFTARSQCWQV